MRRAPLLTRNTHHAQSPFQFLDLRSCNLAVQSPAFHGWHHNYTQPLITYCRHCSAPFRAARSHSKPTQFSSQAYWYAWRRLPPSQQKARSKAQRRLPFKLFLN